MMRFFLLLSLGLAAPVALAQTADPSLDDILAPDGALTLPGAPQGPSELDELSQDTSDGEFSDFDKIEVRKPVSVTLRALDKLVAKYTDITVPMGQSATFGTLTITARTCDKRPPEEFPETTAFIEVLDSTPAPASNLKISVHKKKQGKVKSEPAQPAPLPAAESHGGAISPITPASALPENMIFSGWMFASTPALSALQHPVYDVWVIDCKTVKAGS